MKSEISHIEESDGTVVQVTKDLAHNDEIFILDINAVKAGELNVVGLKLDSDGHTILVPQPSEDPNDPVNWSWMKKSLILFTISISAFLADFQGSAPVPCIVLQAQEWGMTPNETNYANNLNVLMTGLGGVFWIPFIYTWGRAPVLFWSTVGGAMFTLGCALSPSFRIYYSMRVLMGFTLTAGQTIGLAFIQDMFFFHEHAKKIGIWTSMFIVSPYCGPLFASFIIDKTGSWRNVFWMMYGLGCASTLLIIFFIDESWYRRDIAPELQPPRGRRWMRVLGVWQIQNHNGYFLSIGTSCRRLAYVLFKPIIIPIMISYALFFMWAVGINQTSAIIFATPVTAGGYGFSILSTGYLYFTPIVAVCIGEIFGHFFNDFVASQYTRTHHGNFKAEARLVPSYIAAAFMIPGIILIGQALTKHLHYAAIIMGWGMYVFGCMIASVAVTAYALDAYPTGSGEVSGFINVARLCGGFAVGYFQQPWGNKVGYDVSFGTQAGLIGVGLSIIICLHIFGLRMRRWGGKLEI